METHKPRTASINDFREWKNRGELVLQPRFQRREVWSAKAKSFLIETILKGFPIPAIYIRQKIDLRLKKTIREIVDGQQRISAILNYLNDEFTISKVHNKRYGGLKFSELSEEVQKSFLGYDLTIDLLVGASDSDVLDVFARINSYTVVLNRQEKLNAEFSGKFKQIVFDLGRAHLEFWRKNGILSDINIMRMKEAELCSDLVIAMIDRIQDAKKARPYYKKYDDDFPQELMVVNRFKHCIDKIAEIFGDNLVESEFRSSTLFYSIFCVIYDLLYGLPDSETPNIKIKKEHHKPIMKALSKLEKELTAKETSPEYSQFRDATTHQTTNQTKRQLRYQTILKEILKELKIG